MKHGCIYIFGLILYSFNLLTGCQQNGIRLQLISIDSLLMEENVDSAITLLSTLSLNETKEKGDSAYYYLLLTEAQYRKWIPTESDSTIDYSLNYYKKTSDIEKLARAYYYKGVTNENNKCLKEKILLIKQAEKLADKTNNQLLQHKIYEKLAYFNGNANANELALFYAKKAWNVAKQLDDKDRQAVGLCYMATAYSFLGRMDSLALCVQSCIPLTDYMTDNDKAYLYNRIGELYADKEPEMAKKYLKESIAIKPLLLAYVALSNIYMQEHDYEKAEEVWKRALQARGGSKAKSDIFRAMRQQSIEQKDYQRASDLADSMLRYQEKYYEELTHNQIVEIQTKYDKETAEKAIKTRMQTWGLGLTALLTLAAGGLSVMGYQSRKAKKDLRDSKSLLAEYKRQAEELEASGKADAKQITELHRKIDELRHQHAGILSKGKELYQDILAGGTTSLWHKEDFLNYLEYYKMIDMPFVNKMQTDYNNLSPKYIFFAIMEHEGRDDVEIMRVMGISEGTLRSTRSRINNRQR